MHEYEPVELDFLDTAPIRFSLIEDLPVSAGALFDLFEDPDAWGWATIERVTWETPKPYGVGTTRTVTIAGQGDVQERFLLWEPGRRMAFRFERGEPKAMTALVEDYAVAALGDDRCRLTWTIAMRLGGVLGLLSPVLGWIMRRQFRNMLDDFGEEVVRRQGGTSTG